MTIVEVVLSTLDLSVVRHLGYPVGVSVVLKVVSSVTITSKELNVGSLFTKKWVPGVSKWMLIVLGMR